MARQDVLRDDRLLRPAKPSAVSTAQT